MSYEDEDEDEDEELLHILDLEEMPALPRYKYSVHVGDRIEYKSYESKNLVEATVMEISDPILIGDATSSIHTSLGFDGLDSEWNSRFNIISSKHSDAPPVKTWHDIK